jgi:hypothetical protein
VTRPLFTRESRIRIDRDGHFWDAGVRVEHPKLARAFSRWIAVDAASGRYILKNEIDWCFIEVDDAPLVVRQVVASDGEQLVLRLSDDSEEPLDAATLRLDSDNVPYCTVKAGTLPARFSREAAFTLLDRLPDAAKLPRVPRGEGARRASDRSH